MDPKKVARYKDHPQDPLIHATWVKALEGGVELEVETRAQFQRLRNKLYTHRWILRANDDPLATSLFNLSITSKKEPDSEKWKLRIGPADEEIYAALKRAGIQQEAPDDDFLNPEK